MTGTGSYDSQADQFILSVQTTGRWKCDLTYTRTGEDSSVTGKCDGKSVREHHSDEDHQLHTVPDLNEQRKDH